MKNASIHLGAFLENFWKFVSPTIYFPSSNSTSDFLCRLNILKKTDKGFDIAIPHFRATDCQAFTWTEQAVPATILALLRNYTDPSKNISGNTYPIVNANISYSELAALTEKGAPYAALRIKTLYAHAIRSPRCRSHFYNRTSHRNTVDRRDGERFDCSISPNTKRTLRCVYVGI
jgi:hypothetical protein